MDIKVSNMFFKLCWSVTGADENRRMSSANIASLRVWGWEIGMPDSLGDCKICLARGSIAILNKSGDRGQPCCIPLCRINGSDRVVVVLILAVGWLYWAARKDMTFPWKLMALITRNNKSRTMLSKAFSASGRCEILVYISSIVKWCIKKTNCGEEREGRRDVTKRFRCF